MNDKIPKDNNLNNVEDDLVKYGKTNVVRQEFQSKDELQTLDFKTEFKVGHLEEDDEFIEFEGLASTFGNIDLGDDIVVKGAFEQSLLVRRPKLLLQHRGSHVLGTIDEAFETAEGLVIKGRMPRANSMVQDLEPLLKMGAIDSFSIGFSIKEFEIKDDIRMLQELELFEVSFVTFPMNPQARVAAVKAMNVDDVKENIKTKRDFEKILRESGVFSKEACILLASHFQLVGDESDEDESFGVDEAVKAEFAGFKSELINLIKEIKDE